MTVIRCHYCPRLTPLTEAGARYVGWRFYRGVSLTGKRLDDVICPKCSGRGPDPGIPSWDIRCTTCGWMFLDDWDLDQPPVISAKEALELSTKHSCREPVYEFMDQGGCWHREVDEGFQHLLREDL